MPWPIAHLWVARLYAEKHPALLRSPEYYLGTLATDAIVYRPGETREMRRRVHFDQTYDAPHPVPETYRIAESEWERLAALGRGYAQSGSPSGDFMLGYLFHIFADMCWMVHFGRAYERYVFDCCGRDAGALDKIFVRENVLTDYELCREAAWIPAVFSMLARAECFAVEDLLTAEEIRYCRDHVLAEYTGPCPEEPPLKYLTAAAMKDFFADTARRIDALLWGGNTQREEAACGTEP